MLILNNTHYAFKASKSLSKFKRDYYAEIFDENEVLIDFFEPEDVEETLCIDDLLTEIGFSKRS